VKAVQAPNVGAEGGDSHTINKTPIAKVKKSFCVAIERRRTFLLYSRSWATKQGPSQYRWRGRGSNGFPHCRQFRATMKVTQA
jgi:hypothetical protein